MDSDKRRDSRGSWDWDDPQCRAQLDEIFFRQHDYIQAGSPEHRDFWAFFTCFQRFRTKKDMDRAGTRVEKEKEAKQTWVYPKSTTRGTASTCPCAPETWRSGSVGPADPAPPPPPCWDRSRSPPGVFTLLGFQAEAELRETG